MPELDAIEREYEEHPEERVRSVIVLISDEHDNNENEDTPCTGNSNAVQHLGSGGTPTDWFNQVRAVKGVETNVVVLSLIAPIAPQSPDDPAVCPITDKCSGMDYAEPAPNQVAFTKFFTHGVVGRICDPDYSPFFRQAVSTVKTACEGYTPPR